MTVISEHRRDVSAIAWFLIAAFGVAAWRGAAQAPVLALGMGSLAVVGLGTWLGWRLRPARELRITSEEIAWGRPGSVISRIPRSAGRLSFRRSLGIRMQTHWWLGAPPDSGAPAIVMLGFDLDEVRRACLQHGWEFSS